LDHRKKDDLSFEDWIGKDWVRNAQTQRIAGSASAAAAIDIIERRSMFVGLTERFDESMVLLKALRAGDLDIDYARVNVAKRDTVAKDLLATPHTRQLLLEANREDLDLYEFVGREIYPRFQREFGPTLDADVAAYGEARRERFDRWHMVGYRLKQHLVHKPLLSMYRRHALRPIVEKLLG
jgi:hypothetical protein